MTNYQDTEGRWRQDIERRLRTLETAPRAAHTSISDDNGDEVVRLSRDGLEFFDPTTGESIVTVGPAGVRVYDDAGLTRVLLGRIAAGNYGIRVRDGNNRLRFAIENDGYHDPWIPHPMVAAGASTLVTSGSFVPVYQGMVELITHRGISTTVVVSTDAGATAEVRLRNMDTNTTTSAFAVGAGASASVTFQWLHGSALGGGPVRFDLEARRVSGAANVYVYQPYTLALADPLQCTASGL